MTVKAAVDLFLEQYPNQRVLGYWDDTKGIVLQVSPSLTGRAEEPLQFLVTDDGTIYPSNPVITPSVMKTKMKLYKGCLSKGSR